MQYDNDAKQLKYQVLTQVAKYTFEGTLDKHIQEIPYDIIQMCIRDSPHTGHHFGGWQGAGH